MAQSTVGRVSSLHRYPVKSMAGEELSSAEVTPTGLLGDRAYALIDRETGRVVSAKRPRRWAGILDCRASFTESPGADRPVPPVRLTLPDGSTHESTDRAGLDERLSGAFGHSVGLESAVPEGATFEYHWPDMDGLVYEGRTFRDEITEHAMPADTFFDSSTVLVLTSASLDRVRELVPGSDCDARRFRPNIVIESVNGAGGFVENDWVGGTLRIGDEVALHITQPCIRCVMVTLPQGELQKDPRILKAVFEHNGGHLGVMGDVIRRGRVAIGDAVRLE